MGGGFFACERFAFRRGPHRLFRCVDGYPEGSLFVTPPSFRRWPDCGPLSHTRRWVIRGHCGPPADKQNRQRAGPKVQRQQPSAGRARVAKGVRRCGGLVLEGVEAACHLLLLVSPQPLLPIKSRLRESVDPIFPAQEHPVPSLRPSYALPSPTSPMLPQEDADATDGSSTLYVSNLPFSATEPQVKGLFDEHAGNIRSVVLKSTKGYAFVEFVSPATAAKAAAAVPRRELEGREVAVTVSKARKAAAPSATSRKGDCPPGCNPLKLVVRNVPFEGTAADIRKLFSAHSQIKSVRLPKKVDEYDPLTGTKAPHRGFAFVEFLTREEAKAALQTCSNTHLYGRHLVIEYAADNTSVDALRDKASRKSLADLPSKPAKRKKLELGLRGE